MLYYFIKETLYSRKFFLLGQKYVIVEDGIAIEDVLPEEGGVSDK